MYWKIIGSRLEFFKINSPSYVIYQQSILTTLWYKCEFIFDVPLFTGHRVWVIHLSWTCCADWICHCGISQPLNIGRYNALPWGLCWITIIFVLNSEEPSPRVIPARFTLSGTWKTPEVKLAILCALGRYVTEYARSSKYFRFEFPNRMKKVFSRLVVSNLQ